MYPAPIYLGQGIPQIAVQAMPQAPIQSMPQASIQVPAPLERPTRKRKAPPPYYGNEGVPLEYQPPPTKAFKPNQSSAPKVPIPPNKSRAAPEVIDLTEDSPKKSAKKKSKSSNGAPAEEKRLRKYRSHAPNSYTAIRERALTQRLTVLARERHGTGDVPQEKLTIAGSTGNVYSVNIGLVPKCDCPHAKKGNQCKHIIYVMIRVLKATEHIAYQLALLSSELRDVFEKAPPIPGANKSEEESKKSGDEEYDGNRKPIEGECPICYDDLDPKRDTVVYCKTGCGNNIHQSCMKTWISRSAKGKATCPYCRALWAIDKEPDVKLGKIDTKGLARNGDGYVNVAGQLGLSGQRDYSTYNQYWTRQQLGIGGGRWDYERYH